MIRIILTAFLLFVLLVLSVFGYLYFAGYVSPMLFKATAPSVSIKDEITGFGLETKEFVLAVSDNGPGLDEVLVRAEQNGRRFELFRKTYPVVGTNLDEVRVKVNAKDLGLREGLVKIRAWAFDKTFWSNREEYSFEVPVKYSRPRIEVLTPMHNINQGGTELVFFKVLKNDVKKAGVVVRDKQMPAYPAHLLDSDFSKYPEVYFAFFGIPSDFDSKQERIEVFASDEVGNISFSSFNYLVIRKKFRAASISFTEEFVQEKIQEIYSAMKQETPDLSEDGMFVKSVGVLLEKSRVACAKFFKEFSAKSLISRAWNSPFNRPIAGAPRVFFGDRVAYNLSEEKVGDFVNEGYMIASSSPVSVAAANSGRVAWVGNIGTYGKVVVIDHGFSLFSLYGHLSSSQVEVGQEVEKGTPIGETGSTGFGRNNDLYFEIRIGTMPVNAIEFWDEYWLRDHIENKIKFMKEQLAVQASTEPLLNSFGE